MTCSFTNPPNASTDDPVRLKGGGTPACFFIIIPSVGTRRGGIWSWEDAIPDCKGLESYSFQLQRVDRMRRRWQLTYGAWEDHGSGRQVAEIRVALGRIAALDEAPGLAAYVKCFAPSIRLNNPKRGVLGDAARLLLRMKGKRMDGASAKWEVRDKPKKIYPRSRGLGPLRFHARTVRFERYCGEGAQEPQAHEEVH